METETVTPTTDRRAEAARYRRHGRTADRLRRMTHGHVRDYRGRAPHDWFSLASIVERHYGLTRQGVL